MAETKDWSTPTEPPVAVQVSRGANLPEVLRYFGANDGVGFGGSLYNWAADRFDKAELTDAERQEAWIFASIDLGAKAVSLVEPRFFAGEGPDAPEIESGPVVELFRRPNAYLDGAELQVCDWQNQILSGESFWFLQDRQGEPLPAIGRGPDPRIDLPASFWPISGALITLKLNREKTAPETWEAPTAGGRRVKYPDGSVEALFYRPDKNRAFRGMGPMGAAWGAAVQNHLARRFSTKILQNDGKVGGLIILGSYAAPEEVRRLEREIDDRWDNPEAAGKHRILQGDAKYQAANQSPRDLEYGSLLAENKTDISAVLQTPGALLGLDTSNYATFAGHFRRYISLHLEPWFDKRARYINSRFLPRLRQPSLARHRIRFDLERLWRIVGDIAEQGTATRTLVSVGVPLDDALRHSGVKTDPIPGGEVGMVNTSQIPLISAQERGRALALEARAKAAQALQLAGVDAQEALGLAEIEATAVEPEPAPEPEPPPDTPEEDQEEEAEEEEKAVQFERQAPTAAERRAAWTEAEKIRRPFRRKIDAALKSTLWRMRKAQLKALADYAENGFVPREVAPTYRGPAPRAFADPTRRSLLAAIQGDRAATGNLPPWERQTFAWGTCDGRAAAVPASITARVDTWAARHAALVRRHTLPRLVDLALLENHRLSEADIDALLVVGERRWRDEMFKKLDPLIADAYVKAGEGLASELGVAAINAANPEVLAELGRKSIRVIEGTQSELARRLRTKLLRTLVDTNEPIGGIGGLQAAVKKALVELKATTTAAFKTHSARALTIARTEVGGATDAARFAQIQANYTEGILSGYRWLTNGAGPAPGGTVRASHFALEGVESTPEVGFSSPVTGAHAFHPHGFGVASEDINCFPAGTLVRGVFLGGLEAIHAGPLVVLETGMGRRLTITPNHPVLTAEGWRPAGKIHPGADLVCYAPQVESTGPRLPDDQDGGRPIDEVLDALRAHGAASSKRATPEDLHEDGAFVEGEIHVIRSHRMLEVGAQVQEQFPELTLVSTDGPAPGRGTSGGLGVADAAPAAGRVSRHYVGRLMAPSLPGGSGGLAPGAEWYLSASQEARDRGTADPLFPGKLQDARPGEIALDHVVSVGVLDSACHVYDLQTPGGWYTAEGVVVSNCNCTITGIVAEVPPEEAQA